MYAQVRMIELYFQTLFVCGRFHVTLVCLMQFPELAMSNPVGCSVYGCILLTGISNKLVYCILVFLCLMSSQVLYQVAFGFKVAQPGVQQVAA